ncbi:HAD family hydrolase [Aquabacterium humicola]|uniref:HAD family hydrolase n=1 Tax=Aquabacterium humicola TaxID=3237377 RepID=UPI002543700F|nr:HAD family phosphatase [Rubrivivax pictus]
MKRAILFDMDGTLVDNMAFHTTSWVQFFASRGRQIDPQAFFRRTTGRHAAEILRDWLDGGLSDAECEALTEVKEGLYRRLYAPHLKPLAGLEAFIAQARAQGVRLAVGTAAPPSNVRFTLDGLGLRDHFDAVVGAADVQRGKPDPEVFLKAAQACGAEPRDCIVIEDAPLGLEAARRAGMRAVALTTTMPAEDFKAFDHLIAVAADYRGLSPESLFARAWTTSPDAGTIAGAGPPGRHGE